MKKFKSTGFERDIDECAAKVKALMSEYCCHFEILDGKAVLVDDDTYDYAELHDEVL